MTSLGLKDFIWILAKLPSKKVVSARKKLLEKPWFWAIMEGYRCVTYSDDGTGVELFIGLATMDK